MPASVNRRVPGRELVPHIHTALDLIGRAIHAIDQQKLTEGLELWKRARISLSESSSELAPTCRQDCDAAIEHLERAIAGDATADLRHATHPDLGRSAAKRRRAEQAEAAKLEAARREKIAQYNLRRHGDDIATIERALEQLTKARPNSGACSVVSRLRNDLLCGLQRGITPEQWSFFMQTCRREGINP